MIDKETAAKVQLQWDGVWLTRSGLDALVIRIANQPPDSVDYFIKELITALEKRIAEIPSADLLGWP